MDFDHLRRIKNTKDLSGFEDHSMICEQNLHMHLAQALTFHDSIVCNPNFASAVDRISPIEPYDYNYSRAQLMAHDDPELPERRDISAAEKRIMSLDEFERLKEKEREAMQINVESYGSRFLGFNYFDLQLDGQNKDSLEARFNQIPDKMSRLFTIIHELKLGNDTFEKPPQGYEISAFEHYRRFLEEQIERSEFGPVVVCILYDEIGKLNKIETKVIDFSSSQEWVDTFYNWGLHILSNSEYSGARESLIPTPQRSQMLRPRNTA